MIFTIPTFNVLSCDISSCCPLPCGRMIITQVISSDLGLFLFLISASLFVVALCHLPVQDVAEIKCCSFFVLPLITLNLYDMSMDNLQLRNTPTDGVYIHIYIKKTAIKCLKPTKNATASGGSLKIHSPSLTAKMNLKTFDKARTDNF